MRPLQILGHTWHEGPGEISRVAGREVECSGSVLLQRILINYLKNYLALQKRCISEGVFFFGGGGGFDNIMICQVE